jgi:hypothetical protein
VRRSKLDTGPNETVEDSLKIPKRRLKSSNQSHDASILIEESVVHLHGLTHYCQDQLTPNEIKFVQQCKRNLAIIHRRLQNGTD